MKIALRGGHNWQVVGACGVVDEVTEDRKITAKTLEYLQQLGHEVLDVSPDRTSTKPEDLAYGVNKANAWGADYFASIHLNGGDGTGHGTECLFGSDEGLPIAERISASIATLGFKNRGPKPNERGLYEFSHTKMVNNIIEVFFCDNQGDVDIYNSVGLDNIAIAIAQGITGQAIEAGQSVEQNQIVERDGFNMKFNETYYLATYPDIAAALANGTISSGKEHYDNYGKAEGRRCFPELPSNFTEGVYLANRPDVVEAIHRGDFVCGAEHWIMYGWNENTKYSL